MWAIFTFCIIAILADAETTVYALRLGLVETNPLMPKTPFGVRILAWVLCLGVGVASDMLHNQWFLGAFLLTLGLIKSACAIINILIIRRVR